MAIELEPVRGRSGPETTPNNAPHLLIRADRRARDPITLGAPKTAWRLFGWFGLLLVVVGVANVVSPWYPSSFDSGLWQFNAAAATIGALPILTAGAMAILASVLARAEREGVIAMGVVFAALLVSLVAVLVLFAVRVPIALSIESVTGAAVARKTIVLTVILAGCYGAAYVAAGMTAFKFVFRTIKDD